MIEMLRCHLDVPLGKKVATCAARRIHPRLPSLLPELGWHPCPRRWGDRAAVA